jgi:hypothetical protein
VSYTEKVIYIAGGVMMLLSFIRLSIFLSVVLFPYYVIANSIVNNGVVIIDGQTMTNDTCVKGNGVKKSETRKISNFNRIELSGIYTVLITNGKTTSFVIEGDENIIKHIVSDINATSLNVYPSNALCPSLPLKLVIALADLSELSASGAMEVDIQDVANKELRLTVDGSAVVRAAGTSESLNARISGTGNIEAADLLTTNAKIIISGVGDATVQTSNLLEVEIQGVGNVYHVGNPDEVRQNISGVGTVTAK